MGYAVRISSHAIDVVTGADKTPGIVAAEATGAGRKKWSGGELRSRVVRQGSGWTVDGGSPYGSYNSTPVAGGFSSPGSPYFSNPVVSNSTPGTPGSGHGLGLSSPSFGPSLSPRPSSATPDSFPTAATAGSPYLSSTPVTASPPTTAALYSHFPPTPNYANGHGNGNGNGFPQSPKLNGAKHYGNGSLGGVKKDD